MKNKKGGKNQKFIAQVEKQVKSGGNHPLQGGTKKDEKEKKLQEQKELLSLFRYGTAWYLAILCLWIDTINARLPSHSRPVQSQKVEKGTDPKSVICAFFKAGQCGKGDRCKFSHDMSVERKVEKRSLYVDMRDDDENDTMDNWDDGKLREVVDKKHSLEKRMPTTDIVSSDFIAWPAEKLHTN